MRDRGFRQDAVTEIEDQPAFRVIRQHVVDRAIERGASGNQHQRIEIALHGDLVLHPLANEFRLGGPVDADGIDWTAEPSLIRERVQSRVAVQGNLDPLALIAGGDALHRAVDEVLANYAPGRLIFNLGHGIQPETPIAHVEQMTKRVREYKG